MSSECISNHKYFVIVKFDSEPDIKIDLIADSDKGASDAAKRLMLTLSEIPTKYKSVRLIKQEVLPL